ncbi:flagellar biosynthetic protein FliR [Vogesella alkaliphila]|uniref:Flagellar biosynthetic protein FliR n=1 Tax=Vogesella alkaliphila TaxID=1193621 RepID=A0ABQ2YEQ3_9NEIS|nr:flagellar biosynthetic protein FliR [Vogesella alkaliphila]GGX79374.1 flagellar biosynthetic protein FliR [Vogesella alkaliphila]
MFAISDAQINLLVAYFVWPFSRILGVLLADPLFASRSIPRRFKAGFALLLTLLVAPLLPPLPTVPLVSAAGLVIVLQQLLIGIIIGFVMRIVITAVELAGFIMATQMGLGFAMFFDPQHAAQVPAVSRVLTILTTLLFLAFDGHHILLTALMDSFDKMPIGVSVPALSLRQLAEWGGHLFLWGLWLSLPVVGSLLVTNLAIGVMTRAAPQFNVFSFGFPLTLAIGFIALYLVLPLLEPAIAQIYRDGFGFISKLLIAP